MRGSGLTTKACAAMATRNSSESLPANTPCFPGLSPDRARDVLLLLTGPVLYSHLTRDMGWGREAVEQWVVATVGQQLFGIDTTR